MFDHGEIEVYQEHGYRNRLHYLECLIDDHGVDHETVWALADLLGPDEDFDGLISALQDL